jgi:hypothetical protein
MSSFNASGSSRIPISRNATDNSFSSRYPLSSLSNFLRHPKVRQEILPHVSARGVSPQSCWYWFVFINAGQCEGYWRMNSALGKKMNQCVREV